MRNYAEFAEYKGNLPQVSDELSHELRIEHLFVKNLRLYLFLYSTMFIFAKHHESAFLCCFKDIEKFDQDHDAWCAPDRLSKKYAICMRWETGLAQNRHLSSAGVRMLCRNKLVHQGEFGCTTMGRKKTARLGWRFFGARRRPAVPGRACGTAQNDWL